MKKPIDFFTLLTYNNKVTGCMSHKKRMRDVLFLCRMNRYP